MSHHPENDIRGGHSRKLNVCVMSQTLNLCPASRNFRTQGTGALACSMTTHAETRWQAMKSNATIEDRENMNEEQSTNVQ